MVSKLFDHTPVRNSANVLDVPDNASNEEIRAAYLKKVKQYPPDRYPDEFESIRDAFNLLSNDKKKLQLTVLSADPNAPVSSLLDSLSTEKKYVGPRAWLEALKEDENEKGK